MPKDNVCPICFGKTWVNTCPRCNGTVQASEQPEHCPVNFGGNHELVNGECHYCGEVFPTQPTQPSNTEVKELITKHVSKASDYNGTLAGSVGEIMAIIARREAAAEERGLRRAAAIVIRRTEIPAYTSNPTRDAIVELGEEIRHLIIDKIPSNQRGLKDGEKS